MYGFTTRKNFLYGAVLLLSAGGARLFAADDLPKADTILDKYVEVTGGKAAYQKQHSVITSGTMEFGAMGMKGKVTSYHSEPNKVYTEVELEGIGKIIEGFDGKVAWSTNAMQGPHIKEGVERAQALQSAEFNSELNWRNVYKKVETTGVETVDGKECYKVVLTPNEGSPMTQYFDKQSGLLTKMTMTAQGPMGEMQVESIPSDYRKEGDILVAHKVTQKAAGQEFSMTLEKVQHNPEIPASRFDLPDDIKALVNKK